MRLSQGILNPGPELIFGFNNIATFAVESAGLLVTAGTAPLHQQFYDSFLIVNQTSPYNAFLRRPALIVKGVTVSQKDLFMKFNTPMIIHKMANEWKFSRFQENGDQINPSSFTSHSHYRFSPSQHRYPDSNYWNNSRAQENGVRLNSPASFSHFDFRYPSSSRRHGYSGFDFCPFNGADKFSIPNIHFQNNRTSFSSKWKRGFHCFRCGDKNHKVKDCSNPVRCFNCGVFGHKKSLFRLTYNPFLSSVPSFPYSNPVYSKPLSFKEHHYFFAVEFLKLRRLFLDCCVGNYENYSFLFNKAFWNFDS